MTKNAAPLETPSYASGFQVLKIESLFASPMNTRRHIDKAALEELTNSIKTHGVLTPLLVRPMPNSNFEIAAGERRYRAALAAGLETVPAIVREMDDVQFLEVVTIENLQREDIHELDEGLGYARLMREAHYTVEQVADKVGKSVSYVYQRLKLADLIEPAQKLFLEDKFTASHAILVARLQPKDQQKVLDGVLFEKDWLNGSENPHAIGAALKTREFIRTVSVRELEVWIHQHLLLNLQKAPWKKDDAQLYPQAGACTTCPKRAANQPQLFTDVGKGDVCTDGHCFGRKLSLYVAGRMKEVQEKTGKPPLKLTREYGRGGKDVVQISTYSNNKEVRKDSCKSASPGVIVSGPGTGQLAHVCLEKTCKVHHQNSPQVRRQTPAQIKAGERRRQKRRLEEIVDSRLAHAILDRFDGNLAPRILQLILLELLGVIEDYDTAEVASQRFGINIYAHGNNSGATVTRILQMKTPELGKFLLCLAFGRRLQGRHWFDSHENQHMRELAGLLGIDVKKLEAEERARAKEREKLGLKAGTCRICSCTEEKPCKPPCSWTDRSETLCSNPKCVKAAQAQTSAKGEKRAR